MSYEKCLKVISEINEAVKSGDEISYEPRLKELRWVWTSKHTGMQWDIKLLSHVKRLSSSDLRTGVIIRFCQGEIMAEEALNNIQRLENLKAFW